MCKISAMGNQEMIRLANSEIGRKNVRVVIYGNNQDDRINYVSEWAERWFDNNGFEGRHTAHVCKVRGAIEDAFYGKSNDSDPKKVPDLVLVGRHIRDADQSGWADYELGGRDLETIQKLCEQYQVPLVRYNFDKKTGKPEIVSGRMMLRETTSDQD